MKRKSIGFLKKIFRESRRVVRGEMQHGSTFFVLLDIFFLALDLFSTVVALWVVFVLFLTVGSTAPIRKGEVEISVYLKNNHKFIFFWLTGNNRKIKIPLGKLSPPDLLEDHPLPLEEQPLSL